MQSSRNTFVYYISPNQLSPLAGTTRLHSTMLPIKSTRTIISHVQVTEAMLFRITQLVESANRRIVALETSVAGMIQTALTEAATLLKAAIDELNARVEECERGQGTTSKIIILKDVDTTRKTEVEQVKSITRFKLNLKHKYRYMKMLTVRNQWKNTKS